MRLREQARTLVGVLTALLACGPKAPGEATTDGGSEAGTSAPWPTTSVGDGVETSISTTSSSTTTAMTGDPSESSEPSDPDSGSEDSCGGRAFKFDLSSGSSCSLGLQDCPCGTKCAPVGGELHCIKNDPEPVGVGEACTIEGGHDDCEPGSACNDVFLVDFPRCVALCDEFGVGCPDDGTVCMPGDGQAAPFDHGVCLRPCDPLMSACAAGEECAPVLPAWLTGEDFAFACMPEGLSTEMFGACDLPSDCGPGLGCVNETPVPCGPDEAFGCCVPYCELPEGVCPGSLICSAWFDNAMPGFEHVGACVDPG
jgi:hypothetical protein